MNTSKVKEVRTSESAKNTALAGTSTTKSHEHISNPLARNHEDRSIWCSAKTMALLEQAPDWQGCLRHDAFLVRNILYQPLPSTGDFATNNIRFRLLKRAKAHDQFGTPVRFLELSVFKGVRPLIARFGRFIRYGVCHIRNWMAQRVEGSTNG